MAFDRNRGEVFAGGGSCQAFLALSLVPEPATAVLFGFGVALLLFIRFSKGTT